MLSIFGQALSFGELLGLFTALATLFSVYYNLNNKVSNIEERNKAIDEKNETWQSTIKTEWDKGHVELVTKYSVLEERLRNQEHSWIRFDEKLNNIQKVLEELKASSNKD